MILLDPRVERQITADVAERRYFLETIEAPENFTDRAIKKEEKKDGSKENGNSVNFKIAINLAAFFRYAPLFASLKQKPFVSTDFKKVFRKFMRYLAVTRRGEYRAPFARVS